MDTNVNGVDMKGNVSADEVKASLGYASQDVYMEGEVKNDYSQNLFSGINQPGQSSYSLGMAQNFNEGALSVAAIAKQDFEGSQSNTLSLGSNNNGVNVTGFMTKNQFNQFIAPTKGLSDGQFSANNLHAQTAGVAINTLNTSFVGTVTTAEGMTNVKGIPTKSEGGKAYQMALQYKNVGANYVQGVGREGQIVSKDISLGYTSPQGVSAGPLTFNTVELTKHSVSDDIARLNLDHSRNSFQAKGHIGDVSVRVGNHHIGVEYRAALGKDLSPMKSKWNNSFATSTQLSWMQGASRMHLTGAQEAELSTAEADLKAAQNAHKILELDVKKEKAALEQLQQAGASEVEIKAAEAKVAKAEAILADNEAKQAAAKKAIQSIQNIPASPKDAVDAAKGLGGGMGTVAIGAAVIAGAAMSGNGGSSTPAPAPEAAPVVPALSFVIADPAMVSDGVAGTLNFTVNNLSQNYADAGTALTAMTNGITLITDNGAVTLDPADLILTNFTNGTFSLGFVGNVIPGQTKIDTYQFCLNGICVPVNFGKSEF